MTIVYVSCKKHAKEMWREEKKKNENKWYFQWPSKATAPLRHGIKGQHFKLFLQCFYVALLRSVCSFIFVQPCIIMRIFLTTMVGLKSCDVFSRLERGKNCLISFWNEKLIRTCILECLPYYLNKKITTETHTRCSYQDCSRRKCAVKLLTGCYCSHKGGRKMAVNLKEVSTSLWPPQLWRGRFRLSSDWDSR